MFMHLDHMDATKNFFSSLMLFKKLIVSKFFRDIEFLFYNFLLFIDDSLKLLVYIFELFYAVMIINFKFIQKSLAIRTSKLYICAFLIKVVIPARFRARHSTVQWTSYIYCFAFLIYMKTKLFVSHTFIALVASFDRAPFKLSLI